MKKLLAALLLVTLLAGALACSRPVSEKGGTLTTPAVMYPPEPTAATKTAVPGIMPRPEKVPEVSPTVPPASGVTEAAGDRLIVRTGYLTMVVEDVPATIDRIVRLAATYNGFVVASNTWKEGDRVMGNISIRVEVQHFDDAVRELHGLAVEVRSESTSGEDVTEEYVDLTARLRNLEAAEAQLLKLMEEKTEKVTDILEVQRELVKTRGEIEQTKGRLQYLEQSAAMSLIQVNLEQSKLTVEFNADTRNIKEGREVRFFAKVSGGFAPYSYSWDFGDGSTSTEEQPAHVYRADGKFTVTLKVTDDRGNADEATRSDYITVLPGWSAGDVARGAWNGLVAFFHVILDIIIWLGIFSPLWIVILAILYFTWWRRRKKA